jgi:hypothetical protein
MSGTRAENAAARQSKIEKASSFLKKRTKKLLIPRSLPRGSGGGIKSFLLLFFKKEALLPSLNLIDQ